MNRVFLPISYLDSIRFDFLHCWQGSNFPFNPAYGGAQPQMGGYGGGGGGGNGPGYGRMPPQNLQQPQAPEPAAPVLAGAPPAQGPLTVASLVFDECFTSSAPELLRMSPSSTREATAYSGGQVIKQGHNHNWGPGQRLGDSG